MELLHMVPVPDQVPLSDAYRYMRPGEDGLAEAMLYLNVHFPVSRTIRYCRNIARGIVSTVRERHADMLVMGWRTRDRRGFLRPGSLIDPVLRLAPSHVVIMKGCADSTFERILVPVAGGRNAALALEVAGMVADRAKGRVEIFNVITPQRAFSAEKFLAENRELVPLPDDRISVRAVPGTDVVVAILAEAREHDLTVIGETAVPLPRRVLTETIPSRVVERLAAPVILVRAGGGVQGTINRWT
jgi:nucleotide-binding universal stress UspA family protein